MKVFLWGMLGFVLGLIAGYCVILFGWVAYSNLVLVADMNGGISMGVAFGLAPLGGLLGGAILAFILGRRATRKATA